MAKVAFRQVSKRFDNGVTALKQFSLDIEDGEFIVLVGPSGCGKSTALRLLAGLEDVTEGQILIDDVVVNDVTTQQRNIAMVFQNYALYPHMSVRGNLAFPLKMAHWSKPRIERKVSEIARMLNLSALLERKPKQLSGGQSQRVAMGRALVRDPSVFLLDEPLSNLDARLRVQIRGDITKLQKRLGKTTVYVTHDQVEAMTLGDRVAVMHDGVIQQVDTPGKLYRYPASIFVAGFIGSPGMNIVAATLVCEGNEIAVDIGGQRIPLAAANGPAARDIARYIGNRVYAGIRPEAFSTETANCRVAVNIDIQSVEYLGHESLLYFDLAGSAAGEARRSWIARIADKPEPARDRLTQLYVDADAVYLFDEAGVLISPAAAAVEQVGRGSPTTGP